MPLPLRSILGLFRVVLRGWTPILIGLRQGLLRLCLSLHRGLCHICLNLRRGLLCVAISLRSDLGSDQGRSNAAKQRPYNHSEHDPKGHLGEQGNQDVLAQETHLRITGRT